MIVILATSVNNIMAQSKQEKTDNGLIIDIKPMKKIFGKCDSAFFMITFINKSDSVIQIPKFPIIHINDYSLENKSSSISTDIYIDLLKLNKKNIYEPYKWFIEIDVLQPNEISAQLDLDSIKSINKNKIKAFKEKPLISLKKNEKVKLILNLIPYKNYMDMGKYKARIYFIAVNFKYCNNIYSSWAKFIISD